MKIIIDIPESEYKSVQRFYETYNTLSGIYLYIYHGIVLPENHGRLVDADAFAERYETCINGKCNGEYVHAPTIIKGTEGLE